MNETRSVRRWFTVLGVVMLVLGVSAIVLPFAAGIAASLLFGALLTIGGAVHIAHAIQTRHAGGFGMELFLGLVYTAGGVIMLFFPVTGLLTLTFVLAVVLVLSGVLRIVFGFQARPILHWGWTVFAGVVSVILGLLIWAGWPSTAFWVIGLLVGIELLISGIVALAVGAAIREAVVTRTTARAA